jgi:16S rRNA (uracil1498-N3)-methyltransferase
MASPYFFEKNIPDSDEFIVSEDTSRHISQVLRMKEGEEITLTNGHGYTINANIIFPDKKKTKVKITSRKFSEKPSPKTCIAISLIKNNNRFEWFAEKATEIGISTIIPVICHRSEKTHFKKERITSILISAMLQSQQSWLPELSEPIKFSEIIKNENYEQKFIAHCIEHDKKKLKYIVSTASSKIILIGPEGDFTPEEIRIAVEQNYIPVSLGETRLRTETAGIVAAVLMK